MIPSFLQQWRKVLRCDSDGFQYGGDESSFWKRRCLQASYHSNSQVNNETEKKCVESVVKSESYLESEAKSPLYRCMLGITASRFYGM